MKNNSKNAGRRERPTSGAAQSTDANKTEQLMFALSSSRSEARQRTDEQLVEEVKTLIEEGADVNATDKHGNTILMLAAGNMTNPALIKALVEAGADMGAKGQMDMTAFLVSIINDNPAVITALAEVGADVNAKTDDGRSAQSLQPPITPEPTCSKP